MIFPLLTGLGPGGLKKAGGFIFNTACIPGSSHGGIALGPGRALYSDQAYDKQDTVSLLGGSGGEVNYLRCFDTVFQRPYRYFFLVRSLLNFHQ